jgi:hypothetical protein
MIRRFSTAGADDLSRLEEPENDRENDCEHQASDDGNMNRNTDPWEDKVQRD